MTYRKGDVFVPSGPNRRETAILLVGTAKEHNLPDDSVHSTPSGFFITDDLADILYDEDVLEPEEAPDKTSGNRAAKKAQDKE